MAWTAFSAEAVKLHSEIARLNKGGRITDAISAIETALRQAHLYGPSNMSYAEFEAELERRA